MSRSIIRAMHALALPLVMVGAGALVSGPAAGQSTARASADVFQKIAGSWSGAGTVAVSGGSPERVRCRADYNPSGATQLHLELRCASDSFNLQVSSEITREGERIVGNWAEASTGASGSLSGSVGPNQLSAVISGAGTSARLTLAVRGDAQAITLATQGTISATASVSLRR